MHWKTYTRSIMHYKRYWLMIFATDLYGVLFRGLFLFLSQCLQYVIFLEMCPPKRLSDIFWSRSSLNTLSSRQNGRHFTDDVFKCILLNESLLILLKISLKFVPKCPNNNIPSLVQATSHYLNHWWLVYWRIYTSLGLIKNNQQMNNWKKISLPI